MELIEAAVNQFQEEEAINLTRSLIRIPSVSGTEKAIGEYLHGEFEKMKLPV
jgi:acetylornithine deacetylase/succinyl-diaminopimelate desuccinylase-like protein